VPSSIKCRVHPIVNEEDDDRLLGPLCPGLAPGHVADGRQLGPHSMWQDRLARDQVELWGKYVKLLNKSDEKWQTAWLAKRDADVSADGEYGMVALR
jgi:hypothetical protein